MPKRTYQPKKRRHLTRQGFRARMKSRTGRQLLSRRRSKKRKKLINA